MKCPACGCEHPPHYDRCLACDAPLRGTSQEYAQTNLARQQPPRRQQFDQNEEETEQTESPIRMRRGRGGTGRPRRDSVEEEDNDDDLDEMPIPGAHRPRRRPSKHRQRNGSPLLAWGFAIVVVLGAAVGATFYFIKAPDDKRLQEKGEKELANAQYAFAVQTLTKASQAKPQDAKIMLELARAYVGVDQIDKAWDCVSRAQKLGTGVIAEPTLASDLANYYRRRGKYDKAVALLRPLAKADISGKKAELADLDAAWGDDLLAEDKLDQALRCWEEVRELREGSRFTEAEARLSTIYQKLANNLASKNDDEHALAYLTKLNNIAQNARNYELAAQIYEREGKLDKSIEQLRKAANLSSKNTSINQKLAGLLARRGKELLDEGSADAGYAFLQQAKDLNPQSSLPNATLKAVAISVDPASHQPKITGELWNPSDQAISSLSFKVELWDDESAKTMWDKEDRLVDQFTPPLGPHESKHFEYLAPIVVTMDGNKELRTYIDGALYKEYPIGKKSEKTASEKKKDSSAKKPEVSGNMEKPSIQTRKPAASETAAPIQKYTPSQVTQTEVPVPTAPALTPAPARTTPSSRGSSEEKTMKDLEM